VPFTKHFDAICKPLQIEEVINAAETFQKFLFSRRLRHARSDAAIPRICSIADFSQLPSPSWDSSKVSPAVMDNVNQAIRKLWTEEASAAAYS